MIRSYVSVALRHLVNQRLYSLINVAGLSVGLACFILIGLFVGYEWSYDSHWAKSDRIYRISRDFHATGGTREAHLAANAGPVAPLLAQDFPQIENVARIFCCGGVAKTPDGPAFLDPGYAMADAGLFEIFDFKWISGDPSTALAGPYDVVLTTSAARRHFGDADPMGQTLLNGGGNGEWEALRVTGVIEDVPDNTVLDFSMLQSMRVWNTDPGAEQYLNDWRNNVFHTYVLLREGADIATIQAASDDFFERRLERGSSASTGFTAIPMSAIHLGPDREGEMQAGGESKAAGNATAVYGFGAVALFILLLACINFMNLATARSAQRAKEIGIRKAIGAARRRVVVQFLSESVVLALLALLIGIALVELTLPFFNAFLGRDLALEYVRDPGTVLALLALALTTGIVAGSYPAFYLSAFEPARVLKGDVTRGGAAGVFRKSLVVLQFSISSALLVATVVIHEQLEFARGIDLGFDTDQVVVVSPNNVAGEEWETLKREWLANPDVVGVTRSDVLPFQPNGRTAEIRTVRAAAERMPFVAVDYDFFETYGIDLVAGRTFSADFGDGQASEDNSRAPFVINELAARRLGFTPDQAIGQRVSFGSVQGTRFRVDDASGPIVGVVRDVHYESLHHPIQPTIYRVGNGAASLRITGRNVDSTLAHIDERWKAFRPDLPASRRFLDQTFAALYDTEERQQQLFTAFSLLAMLIACLGLLGLASFATERRTKEIGIRKVMGGTVQDIVRLFAGEFGQLVLLANLLAWPVAYALMRRWLAGFAYRIDLGPALFIVCGGIALGVALLTVGVVAARAAAAKPVASLRYQ
jgi:putative ABC transport system permease protein